MTGVEFPQPAPGTREDPWSVAVGEPERELPASLYPWVSAMVLWPCVDEPSSRLVTGCFGRGGAPEWAFLASLLVHAGLVASGPAPEVYTFLDEWLPVLDRGLVAMGGADAVRSQLVDAWLDNPDRDLAGVIAGWASDQARWGALDEIWMVLTEQDGGPPGAALRVYRDLPLNARKVRPMLTWASGSAAVLLVDPDPHPGLDSMKRLLLDSALLHADWSMREDTDCAVSAGTIRMIGQRRLPPTQAGQSLEAAWRTKQEIDAFIDLRSRAGRGPGRTSHAIFRAFSARLALFRGDPLGSVSEAHWAALLSDWEPVSALAAGVEALARCHSTDDEPTHRSATPVVGVDDALGVHGLKGMGQALQILADGSDARRRLDRARLDRALSAISPEAAAVAGVWSVRAALAAGRATLWGDPAAGLIRLSREVLRHPTAGREHEEPLGSALLIRARMLLLAKVGAFAAATHSAESIPGAHKLLPLARIHLWAGQFGRAIRIADAAAYEAGLSLVDQHGLILLKAAAALLAGTCDSELRANGVTELRNALSSEAFLPIALLPPSARDVLVDLYRSESASGDPSPQILIARLAELNDADKGGDMPVRLTEREVLLLPLLATDDAVPEIARKLHVSVNTVRKQVVTLRAKFGADTRGELIKKATAYGAVR